MSIKKISVIALSTLGLLSASDFASASSLKPVFGVRLAANVSKSKTSAKLTSYAINSLLNQCGVTNAEAETRYYKLHALSNEQFNSTFLKNANGGEVLNNKGTLASNLQKIMVTRYTADTSDKKLTYAEQWADEATNSPWDNSGKWTVSGNGTVYVGVKTDFGSIALGGLFDYAFVGKKVTMAMSSASKSDDKKDNNDNNNSSSKNDLSIESTEKFSWGFCVSGTLNINPCFYVRIEGGVKNIKKEFDVTKINTNFLGIDGTPTYANERVSKDNTKDETVKKGARSDKVVNKLTGTAWVPYLGGGFGYKFTKNLSAEVGGGYRFARNLKLKEDKTEIKNPDFSIEEKGGMYFYAGINFQI